MTAAVTQRWLLQERPAHFPNVCFLCGQEHGPVVDTGIEQAGSNGRDALRVYVCRGCAEKLARTFKIATAASAAVLADAQAELQERDERLQAMGLALEDRDRLVAAKDDELERQRAKVLAGEKAAEKILAAAQELRTV